MATSRRKNASTRRSIRVFIATPRLESRAESIAAAPLQACPLPWLRANRAANRKPASVPCPVGPRGLRVVPLPPAYATRTPGAFHDARPVQFSEICETRRRLSDPGCESVHLATNLWDHGSSPAPTPGDALVQSKECAPGCQ